MKPIALLAAAGLSVALSACASDRGGGMGGGIAALDYSGYNADAYGPFYGGYWGGDGPFYYSGGRPFARVGGGHIGHSAAPGMHGGARR